MRVLNDPSLASHIDDPDLRRVVDQSFVDMAADDAYDPDIHGFMIIVEPGDRVEVLEQETGCPILHNLCNEIRFGEPGFSPCFEVLEEHPSFYELVFITGGGDFGVLIFIPKQEDIHPELLALCAEYAVPAP